MLDFHGSRASVIDLSSYKLLSDCAVLITMPAPGIPRHLVYAVAIVVLYPPEWGLGDNLTPDGSYIVILAYFRMLADARRFARSLHTFFSLPYIRREHLYVDSVQVRLSHSRSNITDEEYVIVTFQL